METRLIVRYFVNVLWYHFELFCPQDSAPDLITIIGFARRAVKSLQASEKNPDDYMIIAFRKIIISILDDFGNFAPEAEETVPWNDSEKKFLLECATQAIEMITTEIDMSPDTDKSEDTDFPKDSRESSDDFLKKNGLTMGEETPSP